MTTPERRRPAWLGPALWWGAFCVGAVLLGLLADAPEAPAVAGRRSLPRIPAPPADLGTALYLLGVGSTVWYAAALTAPALAFGARRLDPERHGWGRTLGVATVVLGLLAIITSLVRYFLVYPEAGFRPSVANYLVVTAPQQFLPWIALGGLVALIEVRRRATRGQIERERLRAQLAEQRLLTLTAQLHPHFLFNTLQGISTLIHRDPAAADDLLTKLGDLLREVLRHRDQALVPLRDELALARTYLEISQLRFPDRLRFAIEVPDDLHDVAVPLFLLQPLIENAVAHGIGERLTGGRITIRGRRDGGRVRLEVADDGAGIDVDREERLGLGNTRERLQASFGADATVRLEPGDGGGVRSVVEIPGGRVVSRAAR
jgi:signal transduction histidine kinase